MNVAAWWAKDCDEIIRNIFRSDISYTQDPCNISHPTALNLSLISSLVLPQVPLFSRVACDICIMLSSSRRPLLWVSSAVLQQSSPLLLMPLGLCWPSPGQKSPITKCTYFSLTQMIMMTWMLMLMSTINPSPPATNMQLRCNFSHDGSLFPLVLRRCCLQGPEGTCQYKENDVFFSKRSLFTLFTSLQNRECLLIFYWLQRENNTHAHKHLSE